MSLAIKTSNPCQKYQPNLFDKTKCSNCFRPREEHLLVDTDLNKANVLTQGWLLMAPIDTDFKDPNHKNRKWNRRFFILYEHGQLQYKLDDSSFCKPQKGPNLNKIFKVEDGSAETGFKNCIKIEIGGENGNKSEILYIRTDSREDFYNWKRVLEQFLIEVNSLHLKNKKRRPNTMKIRRDVGDFHVNGSSTLNYKNKDGGFLNSISFGGDYSTSNNIIRCKSESHNTNFDKFKSSIPNIYNKFPQTTSTDNLKNSSIPQTPEESPDSKLFSKNSPEDDPDRGRAFSRAERRVRNCRTSRKNAEYNNSLSNPSLEKSASIGLENYYKNDYKIDDLKYKPDIDRQKNSITSSLASKIQVTSPIRYDTVRNNTAAICGGTCNSSNHSGSNYGESQTSSSHSISVRRTKSLDRKLHNFQKNYSSPKPIEKYGTLHFKDLKSGNWDKYYAVLRGDNISLFKTKNFAINFKDSDKFDEKVDLKNAKSVENCSIQIVLGLLLRWRVGRGMLWRLLRRKLGIVGLVKLRKIWRDGILMGMRRNWIV